MGSVRVVLHGGPENGSEVSVPADASGIPTPRFTVPAASHNTKPGQTPPLLVYERQKRLPSGMWRFRYVGAESQTDG